MYMDYYGLSEEPFRLSPDPAFCLRHPTFAKAKAYMHYAVHRAEGFVMITGRPGTGKTTLIEDLLAEVEGKEVVTAHLVSAQLEAEDLMRMAAFNFGVQAAGKSKSELLLDMQGTFANFIADGKRPLLVVDEAQGLSLGALEELRLLTNLRVAGQPMLQIFLVGQEELRDLVLNPGMEQLHQRMIAACHLEPLDFKQSAVYVMHRLKVAGWKGRPVLRARLFPHLFQFSRGVPRRINLFMSRLLLHGALEERSELTDTDAAIILDELKGEYLLPGGTNELFDRSASQFDANDVDPALLQPEQKIGEKLMRRERSVAAPPQPAAEMARRPASSPDHRVRRAAPSPKRRPEAAEAGAGNETSPPRAASASSPQAVVTKTGSVPNVPHTYPARSSFLGLAASVLLLVGVLVLAALIVPIPQQSGSAGAIWDASGAPQARLWLYRLTGGALPLFESAAGALDASARSARSGATADTP